MSRTVEIVRADAEIRRRTLICLVVATLLGAAALSAVTSRLSEVRSIESLRLWLWVTIALMSLGSAAFSAYAAALANRIIRAGRYPTPGQRVVRDTPVKRGSEARKVATLLRAVALVMASASIALPILVWRLQVSLQTSQ
jgi:hypothetical protein